MRLAYCLLAGTLLVSLAGCGDDDFNSDALLTPHDLSGVALPDLASSDLAGADLTLPASVDGGTD